MNPNHSAMGALQELGLENLEQTKEKGEELEGCSEETEKCGAGGGKPTGLPSSLLQKWHQAEDASCPR